MLLLVANNLVADNTLGEALECLSSWEFGLSSSLKTKPVGVFCHWKARGFKLWRNAGAARLVSWRQSASLSNVSCGCLAARSNCFCVGLTTTAILRTSTWYCSGGALSDLCLPFRQRSRRKIYVVHQCGVKQYSHSFSLLALLVSKIPAGAIEFLPFWFVSSKHQFWPELFDRKQNLNLAMNCADSCGKLIAAWQDTHRLAFEVISILGMNQRYDAFGICNESKTMNICLRCLCPLFCFSSVCNFSTRGQLIRIFLGSQWEVPPLEALVHTGIAMPNQ